MTESGQFVWSRSLSLRLWFQSGSKLAGGVIYNMAIFRNSLLYIFVLVAGSFLVVSLQVDSAPDQSFNAWAVGERAEYEAKQAASPHLGIQDNPDGDFNTAAKPTPVLESCLRIVGKKVSGAKYKKVKSAINSIPKGNSARCVVMIGEDFYK